MKCDCDGLLAARYLTPASRSQRADLKPMHFLADKALLASLSPCVTLGHDLDPFLDYKQSRWDVRSRWHFSARSLGEALHSYYRSFLKCRQFHLTLRHQQRTSDSLVAALAVLDCAPFRQQHRTMPSMDQSSRSQLHRARCASPSGSV
jgi:hypothetical protein